MRPTLAIAFVLIHGAIVCASTSCPSLRREAYVASRIDAQLDASAKAWLASPGKGVRIDRARGVIYLSKIFDWFEGDFDEAGGVLAFVSRYALSEVRSYIEGRGSEVRVRYLDYDWSLNDLPEGDE